MMIVNADDFGRSRTETDLVVSCYRAGRITSTTAMMFMQDSERAASQAREIGIDVGLHLNLSERFSAAGLPSRLQQSHERVVRFLTASKYALIVYNPLLRREFRDVVDAQIEEFVRIYGRQPSHIDGHQHQHLCTNVLVDKLIPEAKSVRRSFSFWSGEKSLLNRGYRALVDRTLERHYQVADYFFSLDHCMRLGQLGRVFELARSARVELMTHPFNKREFAYLMSEDYREALASLNVGTYATVCA